MTSIALTFCMIMTVIAYLNGRFKLCRPFNTAEIMLFDQPLILALLKMFGKIIG